MCVCRRHIIRDRVRLGVRVDRSVGRYICMLTCRLETYGFIQPKRCRRYGFAYTLSAYLSLNKCIQIHTHEQTAVIRSYKFNMDALTLNLVVFRFLSIWAHFVGVVLSLLFSCVCVVTNSWHMFSLLNDSFWHIFYHLDPWSPYLFK